MTDETTPKTAEEWVQNIEIESISDQDIIWLMQTYARQVAQQVRQQCAEEARLKWVKSIGGIAGIASIAVDKESILSVNVEQFIK